MSFMLFRVVLVDEGSKGQLLDSIENLSIRQGQVYLDEYFINVSP
jgi:hypothetical protein